MNHHCCSASDQYPTRLNEWWYQSLFVVENRYSADSFFAPGSRYVSLAWPRMACS